MTNRWDHTARSLRRTFIRVALAAALVLPLSGGFAAAATIATPTVAFASDWIVDAATARQLIAGGALVLDARDDKLKAAQPLPGAVPVLWRQFTETEKPNIGKLLADDGELTRRLQAVGVSAGRPVVVIADATQGWGEDGRIVWMLRTLGHTEAVSIDGGIAALVADGEPAIAAVGTPGDFVVARTEAYEVTRDDLRSLLGRPDVVVLDTREQREYDGQTPYGESRGGHVPGAKHIWYKDLLAADGSLLPRDQLQQRLAELGVSPDVEIVSYCTGGIRSGWVTTVLNDLGLKAKNYAGSMWEWSAQPADQFPLVTAAN